MANSSPGVVLGGLVIALVAGFLGFAVGGLGPRAEMRELQGRLEDAEERQCESRGVGRELAAAFRGRPVDLPEPWADSEPFPTEDEAPKQEGAPEPDPDDPFAELEQLGLSEDAAPEDIQHAGELAADAMRLRKAQARAALEESVDLSDEQAQTIDDAIDQMNAELDTLATTIVEAVESGDEPSRRDLMIFASDTLDVMLDADESFYAALDDEQRAGLEEEILDPWSYVDGDVIEILMTLEDEQ